MKFKRVKLLIEFVIAYGLTGFHAQEAISASGADVNVSSGFISFSVGQVVYTVNVGINGSVAEGVQQPYEISAVTGMKQTKDINLICTAYPNPTIDLLTLEVEIADNENLYYQLYDMNVRLLISKKLIGNKNSISIANLAPSTYFLKITHNQKEVKTFTITKILTRVKTDTTSRVFLIPSVHIGKNFHFLSTPRYDWEGDCQKMKK